MGDTWENSNNLFYFSSMLTLMETAKTMIREALPIKCMEAVVLSIYLTNGVPCLGKNELKNFKK